MVCSSFLEVKLRESLPKKLEGFRTDYKSALQRNYFTHVAGKNPQQFPGFRSGLKYTPRAASVGM